jgi:hypothetical protein
MRGLHESGFAAEPLATEYTEKDWKDLNVLGREGYVIKREAVGAGMVPSVVIRMRYTDRGLLTQAALDKNIHQFLKANGFKVSLATSFKPVQVTWKWVQDVSKYFYFPVISTPTALAGLKYSGSAIVMNPPATMEQAAKVKLPNEIYIYTLAVTAPIPGGPGSMTDAEATRVLNLVRQAKVNMASAKGYANTLFTMRGCPDEIFNPIIPPVPPIIVAGFSSLLLIVAYNMVASHVGSERL